MEIHDTLLVACGSRQSRLHLRSVLQDRFNLLEASNTRQMLLLLEQNIDCIASVIIDISDWDVIDRNLHADEHAVRLLRQLPVIVVADKENYQDLTLYFRYGATDVIPLNYDPYAMLRRIETITQLSTHRKHLESVVKEQEQNLRQFGNNMVDALCAIIEYRNADSGHHILRIRNFTQILLEELMHHFPEYGLTERLLPIISSASSLHDLGKISIPDSILTKPGRLSLSECEVMKTHTTLGCELLNYLDSNVDSEYLKYAYNICRYHHERWDGNGYPEGLKQDEIPICAQVVGLTDCYDALTSSRVYKDAYSHSTAVNMILGGECGVFSPKLLECFKNVTDRFEALSKEYSDGRDPSQTITDLKLPAPSGNAQSANLLEKMRGKYYAMVHYMNAFLVEIQLDTGLFQVIYNPYPDLAQVQKASSLHDLAHIAAKQVVIPEEHDEMYRVLREEMPKFVEQDLRRKSFWFHHRAFGDQPSGSFEMTFMRIGGLNRRPSLAVICRMAEQPQGLSFQDGSIMANFTECTYVCRNDSSFTLVRAGKDTHSLGGYTPQEVMDIFGGRLLDMAFPEDRKMIREEFDRQLRDGTMVRTEYRFLCKDASVGWVINKSRLVIGDDGQEYIQTFLFDITESKTTQDRLENTLHRYETLLSKSGNILFDYNVRSGYVEISDTWEQIFGYEPSRATLSRQFDGETHVHPDDILLLLDRIKTMHQGSDYESAEIRIATIKGRYIWCRISANAIRAEGGKLTNITGMISSIDTQKQAIQALEDRIHRDRLTQLIDKEAAAYQIEQYLSSAGQRVQCALLLFDLDNFKEINDRFGHSFGDAMINHVARCLKSIFNSQDIIARIGGDEFMVLVEGVNDRHLLASQCRRFRDMMLRNYSPETINMPIGCSIGLALCPEHGSSYQELFSRAVLALHHVKANGKKDFCFYDEGCADASLSLSLSLSDTALHQ